MNNFFDNFFAFVIALSIIFLSLLLFFFIQSRFETRHKKKEKIKPSKKSHDILKFILIALSLPAYIAEAYKDLYCKHSDFSTKDRLKILFVWLIALFVFGGIFYQWIINPIFNNFVPSIGDF